MNHPGLQGLSRLQPEELEYLIAAMPAHGSFLEVGSAAGATARLISDARPGLRITCVDTMFDIDTELVRSEDGDRLRAWWSNRSRNMNLWMGTFHDFLALRPARQFDVAFVDVDGPFDNLVHALDGAARLLMPGGPILIHDYDHPEWPDVRPAVHHFCDMRGFRIEGECNLLRLLVGGAVGRRGAPPIGRYGEDNPAPWVRRNKPGWYRGA